MYLRLSTRIISCYELVKTWATTLLEIVKIMHFYDEIDVVGVLYVFEQKTLIKSVYAGAFDFLNIDITCVWIACAKKLCE